MGREVGGRLSLGLATSGRVFPGLGWVMGTGERESARAEDDLTVARGGRGHSQLATRILPPRELSLAASIVHPSFELDLEEGKLTPAVNNSPSIGRHFVKLKFLHFEIMAR